MPRLDIAIEAWPIEGQFKISRGAKTQADVIVAQVTDGLTSGRGECVPYGRYGESIEGVADSLEDMADAVSQGLTRTELQTAMPPGAARNALDCAFWDLEAKKAGKPVWTLADLPAPGPVETAFTISLDSPEAMATKAKAAAGRQLLKLKLGDAGDEDRVAAVRDAAPDATLIVDANEAWTLQTLKDLGPAMARLGVKLIEQPLPSGHDAGLAQIDCPVPICADESFHDRESLSALRERYQAVNLKLDKTGGLTEAILAMEEIRRSGMALFVGCMVGTSLAMAPAYLLAGAAEFVDLDGPLLLARDREPGLAYDGSILRPGPAGLWGGL
ncbi:MAG: N-acetyl-D-Glu racemase DgcA [Alphaproteobacteria bacterium]